MTKNKSLKVALHQGRYGIKGDMMGYADIDILGTMTDSQTPIELLISLVELCNMQQEAQPS